MRQKSPTKSMKDKNVKNDKTLYKKSFLNGSLSPNLHKLQTLKNK